MEKVSVILTTFNSERTLQRAVDSIMNQTGIHTLFDIELIVVDDCSTDSTCEILRENGISYLSTPVNSGGPNKGRNIGLKYITGNYFCIMDHDDVWHAGKIMKQLSMAQSFPVVSTGYKTKNQQKDYEIERYQKAHAPVIYGRNVTFLHKLKREKNGQNLYMSSLMLNSRLKDIFFEENFGMVDFDWLLRITENNETVEIPEVLVTRYVQNENLSLNPDYRRKDYYYSLYFIEKYCRKYQKEALTGIRRINGSRARYHYLQNDMKEARRFFMKSEFNVKQVAYMLSSFIGSRYVRSNFIVFG